MRFARTVTDVLQPRNVLLVGLTGLGLAATGTWSGAAWGLFAAVCAGVIPAAYIQWEGGRGTWGDRHVVDRTQRWRIFCVILGSLACGCTAMRLAGAPADVMVAMVALWIMTVGLLVVNSWWKISVDAAVASSTVAMLAVVQSPQWLAAYALVALVCWTRVVLGYHSTAQTVAGASIGAATAMAWIFT